MTGATAGIIGGVLGLLDITVGGNIMTINMKQTKRKKKAYSAKMKLVDKYRNKLFNFTQKVKEYGIITIDEVQQFDELIVEFKNKLDK